MSGLEPPVGPDVWTAPSWRWEVVSTGRPTSAERGCSPKEAQAATTPGPWKGITVCPGFPGAGDPRGGAGSQAHAACGGTAAEGAAGAPPTSRLRPGTPHAHILDVEGDSCPRFCLSPSLQERPLLKGAPWPPTYTQTCDRLVPLGGTNL